MNIKNNHAFEPDELASIRANFDEVCSRIRNLGHTFSPGDVDRLAQIMIRLSSKGLQGRELIDAALRVALDRRNAT